MGSFYVTMSSMTIFLLVVCGLVLGSFTNAAIWRLHMQSSPARQQPKDISEVNLSIVTGRSVCTHCHHTLAAWDLVPVVSYVWLRGRCRYCRKRIDDTPFAELLVPALLVASYVWWPYDLTADGVTLGRILFGFWIIFVTGFVILALYDMRWLLLPDRVVVPLIILAVLQVAVSLVAERRVADILIQAMWGVGLSAGLFYALYIVSRQQWIGFGDVKLAIVLGLLVGGPFNALLMVFLASLFGSLAAVPLLARGKPVARMRIPYGPFLLLATVIVVLFGNHLTAWYLGFLTV
jgi:prepilin signal peptidase PulO-like enzyme (type II secretory pathway)